MLSLNGNGDTKAGTWVQRLSRWATLCGVFCMVWCSMGGCIFGPPPACETAADCDDGDFCNGAESCDAANAEADEMGCVAGTAPCAADQTCVEETDTCIDCDGDDDCQNGNFCDGAETCGADGTCVAGTNPCTDATPICNEEGDVCVQCLSDADCADGFCSEAAGNICVECLSDAQCDDGLFCTGTESCANAACVAGMNPCGGATPICNEEDESCTPACTDDEDCDDGEFCNGAETCGEDGACVDGTAACSDNGMFCDGNESCDEEADACVSSGNPCTGDTPACDEATDMCTAGETCTTDADCPDDGMFCNGTESCDTDQGVCASSGDPCDPDLMETCDEALNTCVIPPPPTLDLSLDTDVLSGTAGADIFSAPILFNPPSGTNVPSLQSPDSLNGGDGSDLINAQLNFGTAGTVAPTLMSVEAINITDFGTAATTLGAGSITGATSINLSNSTNTNVFTVMNLGNVVNLGVSQQVIGATLNFLTAATAGSTDAATVTVNAFNATGAPGTLTLTTGTTNGLETLNIVSNGASRFQDIAQNGTSLATVNVSGSGNLEILNTFAGNVTTINASGATGNTILTASNAANLTYTGGAGNDTILLGGTYTTADTLNGGAGTDTLGLQSLQAAATANQSNVTNFEALTVADGLANAVTTSRFGTITTVNLFAGFTGAVTLTVPAASTVNLGSQNAATDGGAVAAVIDVSGLGTTDALTLALNDHDHGAAAFTLTGVEILNLQSNVQLTSGTAADMGANVFGGALTLTPTFGTGTINITGSDHITFTGAVTAGSIAASAFTKNVTFTATSLPAGGVSIATGTGNDTVIGSAGPDLLNAGTGTNAVDGVTGVDNITLGAGVDTLRLTNLNLLGVDRKLVTAFTAGSGGDVINVTPNFGGAAASSLDGSDNFATATSIQAHSSAGNLSVSSTTEIVRITSGTLTNLTDAASLNGTNLLTAVGGTITVAANGNDHIYLVADGSGNVGVYYGDAGADNGLAAAEITLVAVLQATTIGNFVFSNFSNN